MAKNPTITITGNLTSVPELKYGKTGTPYARFTVANTPSTKNQSGDWVDGDTMFFNCTVFGTVAENVTESLEKGTAVVVTGRFTARQYTRKDGGQGTSLDVTVDEIGASLARATVKVTRNGSNNTPARPSNERSGHEWGTDPAGNLGTLLGGNDAPPF